MFQVGIVMALQLYFQCMDVLGFSRPFVLCRGRLLPKLAVIYNRVRAKLRNRDSCCACTALVVLKTVVDDMIITCFIGSLPFTSQRSFVVI
eukprot:5162279-Pleurochrysis_carterae.AAC.4